MKKVMLFIVSMLFAVSASAATITIANGSSGNSMFGSTTSLPDFATAGMVATNGPDMSPFKFYHELDVTVDTAGSYDVQWGFNPLANLQQMKVFLDGSAISGVLTSTFFQTLALAVGTYEFAIAGIMNTDGAHDFSISTSAVPVPAALFLFAPALMGFLGLRRKAKLAA